MAQEIKIGILNLMSNKIETENNFKAIFSEISVFKIDIVWLKLATYQPKNTPKEYLDKHYVDCSTTIRNRQLQGLIITGAAIETLPFEEIRYWQELVAIFQLAVENRLAVMTICWAAQAGLFYFHGIEKFVVPEKLFCIANHKIDSQHELIKDLTPPYSFPISRHSQNDVEAIKKISSLKILLYSEEAGVFICVNEDLKWTFVIGHPEYDRCQLKVEYERDVLKYGFTKKPENYNVQNPKNVWLKNSIKLFENWLTFCNLP